ncbi:hypothetical protein P691DRAFT_690162, partial [Macrolepiota fuliginosa MF-IS2]
VNVNSIDTWMLWDSGNTMSRITLMFAQIANIKVNKLLDPHTLQLGTVYYGCQRAHSDPPRTTASPDDIQLHFQLQNHSPPPSI